MNKANPNVRIYKGDILIPRMQRPLYNRFGKAKYREVLFLCDACFPIGLELTMGCLSEARGCDICGKSVNCLTEKYHFLWSDDYRKAITRSAMPRLPQEGLDYEQSL